MKLPEYLKKSAETTVGFNESKDKESFKIGALVAFNIAETHYTSVIDKLTKELESAKGILAISDKDLKEAAMAIKWILKYGGDD